MGDGVANRELEEDFCMAGELSSFELMEHGLSVFRIYIWTKDNLKMAIPMQECNTYIK